MNRTFLLLAAAALTACNTGFEPQYRVGDVRLLAIRSRPVGSPPPTPAADVSETDMLDLDALVANPLARAGLEVGWIACLPPGSDAPVPCLDTTYLADPSKLFAAASDPASGVFVLGTGFSIQVPVPDLTAALQFAIYQATLPNHSTYECRLYAEIVVVAVAAAPSAKASVGLKRVRVLPAAAQIPPNVTNRYSLNLNPSFGDVRLQPSDAESCTGGSSIASSPFPAGKIKICGLGGSGAVGSYNVCNPDGSTDVVPEILDWQWYVTDGTFPGSGGVGNAAGGNLDFERPAGAFTLWAIVRDGRGGVDWAGFAVSPL